MSRRLQIEVDLYARGVDAQPNVVHLGLAPLSELDVPRYWLVNAAAVAWPVVDDTLNWSGSVGEMITSRLFSSSANRASA